MEAVECDRMNEQEWLAERFEANRGHMRAVAYRMLGSVGEADDAVQEAWLRLSRSDAGELENLTGWLTTVVARVCLDMLRARKSRREDSMPQQLSEPAVQRDPEQETLMADSVGLALMVMLDRLTPAERLAFVLHDLFAVPFEEVAGIVGRSPEAARQLASRARRRVRGAPDGPSGDIRAQRTVVEAFLAALRRGDVNGLLAVLDPEVVFQADAESAATGKATEVRGAETWARQAVQFARAVRFLEPMLVNGSVGAVLAPRGRLSRVIVLKIAGGKIVSVEVVGEPERLGAFELSVLENE
jgi:RNA polymerase sigma-70 factor (ECF subfamily)